MEDGMIRLTDDHTLGLSVVAEVGNSGIQVIQAARRQQEGLAESNNTSHLEPNATTIASDIEKENEPNNVEDEIQESMNDADSESASSGEEDEEEEEDDESAKGAAWGGRRAGSGRKGAAGGGSRATSDRQRKKAAPPKPKSNLRKMYSEVKQTVSRPSGSSLTQPESKMVLRCVATLVVDRNFTPTDAVKDSASLLGLSQKTVWRIVRTMLETKQVLETDASSRGQCIDELTDKRVKVPKHLYGRIEEWIHECQSKSIDVTGKGLQIFLKDQIGITITQRSGRRLLERLI